jgi:pimeloyl-ACP methyl ester carboxylesterase
LVDSLRRERVRWQASFFSTWLGGIAGYCVPWAPLVAHGYFLSRMYADRSRILPGTIASYNAPLRIRGTIPYLLKVMRCWEKDFAGLDAALGGIDQSRLAFLWGESDKVVPVAYLDELRSRYPAARHTVMPGTGHLPYEELPEQFNQALFELLRP